MRIEHAETGQPVSRLVVTLAVATVLWGVAAIVSWAFPWLYEYSGVFNHPATLIASLPVGIAWLTIAEGFWLGRESTDDETAKQLGAAFAFLTCTGGIILLAVALSRLLAPGAVELLKREVIDLLWGMSQGMATQRMAQP